MSLSLCLWFDGCAGEAAEAYVAAFRACGRPAAFRHDAPAEGRAVLAVAFTLDGMDILALNGGPAYRFTPAASLVVTGADQGEVDAFWHRLSEGGAEGRCGWLTDRFGVSWQVVPAVLPRLMGDPDPARRARVAAALRGMGRLDIAGLEAAAAAG